MSWFCETCKITLKRSSEKIIARHNASARHLKCSTPKPSSRSKKTPKNSEITDKPKGTNETFGITCEKIICDINRVLFPEEMKNRVVETRFTSRLQKNLEQVFKSNRITVQKYSGDSDDRVDFILTDGKTLSVKTNLQSDKICPQIIGQTTRKKFCNFFNLPTQSPDEIKKWIVENIDTLLTSYYKHTFCCDYLLWVNEQTAECKLIPKPKTIHFSYLTFTRTLENWNESNTVKIQTSTHSKPTSLGEFQLHRNRNCIKFRFNLLTLIKLIS